MIASSGLVAYPPERARDYRDRGYWGTDSIPTALRAVADVNSDRIALVTPERRISYGELDRRTDQLAVGFLHLGLLPGDAVTLQVDNSAETVEAWYGLLKAGLIPVCTLSSHRHHEIDEIAEMVAARAHIVQWGLPDLDSEAFALEVGDRVLSMQYLITTRAPAASSNDLVRLEDIGVDLDAPKARRTVEALQANIRPDSPAVYQLSGGTTARPKVIPRLHCEYHYNIRARIDRLQLSSTDVMGFVLPLVHNAGVQTSLHTAHLLGATLVISDPNPDVFLPLFIKEGVTRTILPTGFAASIVDHPDFDVFAAQLDVMAFTLGKVPSMLFDHVTALGTTVIQEFGMGEGLIMTHAPDDPEASRRETVGYPISAADEVRLIDPDGNEVPVGEAGVLTVRGPYTICGYLNEPGRNAEVFGADGFYDTGDVMVAHFIEGRVHYEVADRKKDFINRGGEKVNAAEIEMLLLEHPSISEAALVSMPDDKLGERACAFITLRGPSPTLQGIRAFLEGRGVARFKWPERLEVVDELPKTAVGKIAKNQLRDTIRDLLAKANDVTRS
jgi:2,3-dihydroxybenzoate-AMP ligase